jgi:hypothetical protein
MINLITIQSFVYFIDLNIINQTDFCFPILMIETDRLEMFRQTNSISLIDIK